MTSRRSIAPIVFVTITAYSALMLALAAFVLHPPALGWIGLALATVAAWLAGAAVVWLFAGTRTSSVRLHPRPGDVYRLVIVADTDVEAPELASAVRLRVLGRTAEVRVVAPVMTTPLHFLAVAEEPEQDEASRRLQTTLTVLREAGVDAQGVVGVDDPLQALGDVLGDFPADEVLLVGSLPARRDWLDRDFERQARDLFGVPVATVFGRRKPDAGGGGSAVQAARTFHARSWPRAR